MKRPRWALCILCMLGPLCAPAQTYIPMPADSATWRARDYEIDFVTHVFDALLFVRPADDTVHEGRVYRNVWSRARRYVVTDGVFPPMVDVDASFPDTWMTAYREEGRKVYQMLNVGEKLLYDFTAIAGDRIPGAVGWDTVTTTDSVLLGGVYHKRYLTNEADFWVIEGVGSSYGLLPAMNDGTGAYTFICFNQPAASVAYTPNVSVPCTYVYPINTHTGVATLGPNKVDWLVYPVPAAKEVTICMQNNKVCRASITDLVGRLWWADTVTEKTTIDVAAWPRGTYCILLADELGNAERRLIQVK